MRRTVLITIMTALPLIVAAQNPVALCKEMFAAIAAAETITMKMESYERTGSTYETTKFFIKRSRKPLNIYYRQYFPKDGAEILLKKDGMLWVNPGSFPWVTLDMDVNSSLLLKNQHHTIMDAGFDFFAMVLSDLIRSHSDSLPQLIKLQGQEKINETLCYKIGFSNPGYHLYSYTLTKAETPQQLASRLKIPAYKICELNQISSVTQRVSAGTKLTLPSEYAKSMILWLAKDTRIPAKMEIYDEKGLFEKYIFNEVVINPVFKSNEFEKTFHEYNFR